MPTTDTRPVALLVLDGWGFRAEREGNAIALAETPAWDALWRRRSRTLLDASGLAVGLPEGQMGNSEVGHLNLGAGRVVMQDLVRISEAIRDRSFFENAAFVAACERVKANGGTLHLLGLVGKGGVHGLDQHLFALIDLAARRGVPKVAIHALLDGRDTLPRSALEYVRETVATAAGRAVIASVGGRYYGMDRDKRWPRTELAYRAAVQGVGPQVTDPVEAIRQTYDAGTTDEFMIPAVVVDASGQPLATMRDGDAVICWNYRSDRMRQIVRALVDPAFDGFDVSDRPDLMVVTMTVYDPTLEQHDVRAAFPPQSMARIVAEVLTDRGLTMLKTAETEKYPHVTYFFNGGNETPYAGEERLLVPSQKVATYDLAPEMSARGVTDVLVNAISGRSHNFMLCNLANGDMVGHSGSLPATIQAVQVVDECLARIVAAAERSGTRLLVTADHGNCEMMIDPETGGPHTAHTTNPVPLVVVDPAGDDVPLREGGALCDVGPTVLRLLGVDQPEEMTGRDLRAQFAGVRA
ncbi:2,3-bisphosphoglycerate-independent phosphoglycerate mutase [Roseisolibacter agri]|uniref:2,3-bisphosphoglycerate-independent phosphoglycerate mutase n=1 Tax=Roseisolibacter agri TaxID=2014610 RepID=A0AA37Q7G6_9BACT|nr:2,3-bisphosphoglycerate-independent phosphoglycerate mutase [Roseisolibacter agri]GLC27965.1 2,3-bisphosphoglycerate-independent phosphoglycerate mutase [Roseisolibacter agri]